MTVTFSEARGIVRSALAADWTSDQGSLYVAPTGLEDMLDYLVEAGAIEFILGDDLAYADTSGLVYLVGKVDGSLTLAPYLDNAERYAVMSRTSDTA